MMPVRLCGALVTLAALAACSSGSGSGSGPVEPPVGAIPVVRTGADIVLPLDRYQLTTDRYRLLTKAVDVVGDRCMRRFGLVWEADTSPLPPFSNARRYGNLDPAVAATEGYRPSDVRTAGQPPPMSKDAESVWLGKGVTTYRGLPVPQGGCVGETMRQLKPGIEQIEAGLPQKLQWQSFGLAEQDSRVAQVSAHWRSCMADKGFHYPDTSAAANDPRWTEQVSPQETATAVADAGCRTKTNFAGVMLAVETAYQHRLIEEHAAALAAVMAYADKEVAIARQVVQG